MAANASCVPANVGPGVLVVNAGKTRHSVASVITAANAPPLPAAWKATTWWRTAPTSNDSPTMPLQVIITAAKTVSRASEAVCGPPEAVMLRISPTSMTVTAIARISDPYGSPTRCATTSAWWTATRTAPTRTIATSGMSTGPSVRPHTSTSTSRATTGVPTVRSTEAEGTVPRLSHPPTGADGTRARAVRRTATSARRASSAARGTPARPRHAVDTPWTRRARLGRHSQARPRNGRCLHADPVERSTNMGSHLRPAAAAIVATIATSLATTVAGCAQTPPPVSPAQSQPATTALPDAPSPQAEMVCQPEAQQDIQDLIGVVPTKV